ncbi:MAG TPA: sulfotransferase [Alphaproteobacteria bacterium]|jgi:hypothetical protein|nr:sulfotransferase [Alphaproteobacteria bacterium]|tara:strand:+ start:1442 stop:2737 length:1296 start_codon:yes stop_codon:yes gene_type:complete
MTNVNEMKSESATTQRAERPVSEETGAGPRLNAHMDPGDLTTIVAIFTSGRSGTTLMASLLDSHPYIASTPDQILMGFYVFWEDFGDLESEALTEAFIVQFETLFNGVVHCKNPKSSQCGGEEDGFTTMGENRDQTLSADVDVFRASMKAMLAPGRTVTRRLFTQALHVAYADARGHRLEKGAIILLGLHGPSRYAATALSEDFENPCFLHMVRDPVQTLGSHFRHKYGRHKHGGAGGLNPRTPTMVVRNRYTSGRPGLENLKFQSRAVRLEDLHRAPKRTMSAVCGWLGIPWDETLLESTFNGLKFWNDATSAHQVSGFSQEIIAQKHETYISRFDRFRYTIMFARRFQAFDYCRHNTFLCQRFVFAMFLPLFVFPFRIEWLTYKEIGVLKNLKDIFKYFIKFRLLLLHHTLSPSGTVLLLKANSFKAPL